MKRILLVLISCVFFVGCHNTYHKPSNSIANAKQTGSVAINKQNCIQRCEQRYTSCKRQCLNNCHRCQMKADKQAWKSYRSYYNEMKVQGSYRPRDWLSFRDPLQCRKVTCSCPADLNVCTQQCGGQIKKELRTAAYCE